MHLPKQSPPRPNQAAVCDLAEGLADHGDHRSCNYSSSLPRMPRQSLSHSSSAPQLQPRAFTPVLFPSSIMEDPRRIPWLYNFRSSETFIVIVVSIAIFTVRTSVRDVFTVTDISE